MSVPFVQVNVGLLADQIGVSPTYTLDLGQGVHDLLLAIDVGIEETENELDCTRVRDLERRLSRCIASIQFDFSPETSATLRLAMKVESHSARRSFLSGGRRSH